MDLYFPYLKTSFIKKKSVQHILVGFNQMSFSERSALLLPDFLFRSWVLILLQSCRITFIYLMASWLRVEFFC